MMFWLGFLPLLSLLTWPSLAAEAPEKRRTAGQFHDLLLNGLVARPHKFDRWFPEFGGRIDAVSAGVCQVNLQAYLGNHTARESLPDTVIEYCSNQNDCILDNLVESIKSDMGTAQVLLGLTPVILSNFGPSIAEISVMSTQRPLLTLLLAFGAPAVYPTRLLRYDNPLEVLRTNSPKSNFFPLQLQKRHAVLISIAEYVIAAAAIANVFHCTITLGLWTLSIIGCETFVFPFLWVILALAVHIPAAVALRFLKGSKLKISSLAAEFRRPDLTSIGKRLRHAFWREFEPCASGPSLVVEEDETSSFAISLNYLAGIVAYAQLTWGISVFSSLLYISVRDASFVVARLVASALVCQLILSFELRGLEDALAGSERESAEAKAKCLGPHEDPDDSRFKEPNDAEKNRSGLPLLHSSVTRDVEDFGSDVRSGLGSVSGNASGI